jgi:hypothetical protein
VYSREHPITVRRFEPADAEHCYVIINSCVSELDGLNEAAWLHVIEGNRLDILIAQ